MGENGTPADPRAAAIEHALTTLMVEQSRPQPVLSLDAIEALLDGVSPGPWEFWPGVHGDPLVAQVGRGPFGAIAVCNTSPPGDPAQGWTGSLTDYGRANAIFIAATRTLVPQLVNRVRDQDREIMELRRQLADNRTSTRLRSEQR